MSDNNTFDRRKFLKTATLCAVSMAAAPLVSSSPVAGGRLFGPDEALAAPAGLPPLPYAMDALDPVISPRTVQFHYGKHTTGYYGKLAEAIHGTPWERKPLEEIVRGVADQGGGLFNNAAQAWNHTFYWNGLNPDGGGKPEGALLAQIEGSFGSFEDFRAEFLKSAGAVFGSGWCWLVIDAGKLAVVPTSNAATPLTTAARPLWVVDVWEHAYYLDYQNRRADHLAAVFDRLADWKTVARRME